MTSVLSRRQLRGALTGLLLVGGLVAVPGRAPIVAADDSFVCGDVSGTADELTAQGYNVVIGTDDSEFLPGTPGDDFIMGLGGRDIILAGMGDDVVCGGASHDLIVGGDGRDTLNGDSGNDRLWGGNRGDVITGGTGTDTVVAGDGADVVRGDGGADIIRGGNGDDELNGGDGEDEIGGDAGDDRLFGDDQDDVLRGHSGVDVCDGGSFVSGDEIFSCEPFIGPPFVVQFGGTRFDSGQATAVDADGNVYTTGSFSGTADFDPDLRDSRLLTAAGGSDAFLAKLDRNGDLVWAEQIGGREYDQGREVTVDAAGNVYMTGVFESQANFDSFPFTTYMTSAGGSDAFVSKFDTDGNLAWSRQLGGVDDDSGAGVAVDAAGSVYTTGTFEGTADFDPDPATSLDLTSAGGRDAFVSKLNSDGDLVWVRQVGGTGGEFGFGVAVDAVGNVHTTGYFSGTIDFDPDPADTLDLTSVDGEAFAWKLDSDGDLVWAAQLGGTFSTGIAVDAAGDVSIVGSFSGTADFDPDPADTLDLTSVGNRDVFVSKLDSAGDLMWARRFGGANAALARATAVDAVGNVYTTGYFSGTVDFDPDPVGTFDLTSRGGSNDVFVSKLDSAGDLMWARHVGGTDDDYGSGVAVDAAGNVYTTGDFIGSADFDPDPGATRYLRTVGGYNAFLWKLNSGGNF